MNQLSIILLDGVYYASYIFLVAIGLTLIFGVMKIINMAHGSVYAFGAYIAAILVLMYGRHEFWPYGVYLILPAAAVLTGAILGPILERGVMRKFYQEELHITTIVTFSLLLILDDIMKIIFGTEPYLALQPLTLLGRFTVGGIGYPLYYLVVIAVALSSGVILWLIINKTKFGRLVKAVIHDPEISSAMGIKLSKIYLITFTMGSILAGLGGAITSPLVSVVPGLAVEIIVVSFAVVVIGGLGSFHGAALGSLIVGIVRAAIIHNLPVADLFVVYLVMAVILIIRPQGLFPAEEARKI